MLRLLLTALLFAQNSQNVDSGPIPAAEAGVKKDLFTRARQYMQSNPETLDELLIKDHAVSEGDLVLSSDRNAVENIWPTREIPYVISAELAGRTDDILAAFAMLSAHTCVTFHKRTSETNYLLFTESKGCASYVGFIGGEQPVFVGPPCIVGNIAHELLHALGFHHEHTRLDREKHIVILPHNIMSGMEGNFQMHEGETFGVPYDITSIMHYGSGFFSVNGLPTIVPKDDGKEMGQRSRLTENDIWRVRRLYSCADVTKKNEEDTENKNRVRSPSSDSGTRGTRGTESSVPAAAAAAATGGRSGASREA